MFLEAGPGDRGTVEVVAKGAAGVRLGQWEWPM